ncbi:MAG: LuxR C-terminal-related transcriptional regulator [Bdellovibrionota bacterium]
MTRNEKIFGIFWFMILVGLVTVDLLEDLSEQAPPSHIILEGMILFVAFTGFWGVVSRYNFVRAENTQVRADLNTARIGLMAFQEKTQNVAKTFADHINSQFEAWNLSKSEREVALLLLKGHSAKEIAEHRDASVKTVNQQTSSIYEKSNLHGRSEFAAYFLGRILSPTQPDMATNLTHIEPVK